MEFRTTIFNPSNDRTLYSLVPDYRLVIFFIIAVIMISTIGIPLKGHYNILYIVILFLELVHLLES
jgi:hypothetical protein